MTVHWQRMRTGGMVAVLVVANSLLAAPGWTAAEAPGPATGRSWTLVEVAAPESLPRAGVLGEGTFWDLRASLSSGRSVRFTALDPKDAGQAAAESLGADIAVCTSEADGARETSCRLARRGLRVLGQHEVSWRSIPGRAPARVDARVVAQGVALVPAGAREVVVLLETEGAGPSALARWRFVSPSGVTVAEIEGPLPAADRPFVAERALVLAAEEASDGIAIPFLAFRRQLAPGSTGFLQYSLETDAALSSIHPAWSTVADMISVDATQPDVWDFTGLVAGSMPYRTFNTTRNDAAFGPCINGCAVQDTSASPPDGTWQSYLKIDTYGPGGSLYSQDFFALNDNDSGANPSIDVPYVQQDFLNTDDRTQVCFAQSAGGAERLLRFFRFAGPDPASAALRFGDTWTSGAWTECDDTHGLKLAAASLCGSQCWPGCTGTDPRARGRLTPGGAGFRMTAIEDGWVHVPAGNYVPAVLLRQDTDLLAGLDFLFVCALGATPQRSFDYFWVSERYGLLATVSSPTSETIAADDWSAASNVTDGVDFTWGPFPPYQIEAQACLGGTRVSWALPADGSNLNGLPGIADYGYVVSWGSLTDPEALADWTTNPNHTPLPGTPGYLAAPSGSEPTSFVVQGWAQPSIQATVATALRYTDPNAADQRTYRSAAYFAVAENPARLDPVTFRVGDGVVPFTSKAGSDIALAWPAVPRAASYLVRVYDLATRAEIACPAGMNCTPVGPGTVHPGGAIGPSRLGYRAFAVDTCGVASAN